MTFASAAGTVSYDAGGGTDPASRIAGQAQAASEDSVPAGVARRPEDGAVRIDLHTHSTASDGMAAPAAVVRRAAEAAVTVIALTDHDTVAGHAEAAAALRPGQTFLPGAELSCDLDGASLHLLAYLFDPAKPALAAELSRLRGDRERRARAMVHRLRELGTPVTWTQVRRLAGGEAVGRPHVARAMVEAGVVDQVETAFSHAWLAPGGRAHVPKYAPDPVRAIRLVRAAGGVTVLAHPYASGRDVPANGRQAGQPHERGDRVRETIERLAAAGLCGLEVDHPGHDVAARAELRALAAELDLVATGGSDHHGAPGEGGLGSSGADAGAYERLVSRATGTSPVVG